MSFIKKSSKIADKILCVFTVFLALLMVFYSAYMIIDNISVNRHAFASKELLAYRPDENSLENAGFEELQKINPDVKAWLTIYNTNIDYPVAQGKDDVEYAMKDVFGKQSLSGAIYLSSSNSEDYSDDYNIVFGHHMVNGAMFGDIDKYENPDYFMKHRYGVLQTKYGNYDLKIFAFLRTDAYDNMVYYLNLREGDVIPQLCRYLNKYAENYVDVSHENVRKIIALSTCADAVTSGRAVVFCTATPRKEPIPDDDAAPAFAQVGTAGHPESEDHWALLNLVCVILTLLTLIPLFFTRRKYRQFRCAKRLINKCEKAEDVAENEESSVYEDIVDGLKKFIRKMRAGIVLEIIAVIAAAIAFILTEDITKPIVIRDEWTWLMVLIFALALLIDVIFFRYRGKLPPEEDSQSTQAEN